MVRFPIADFGAGDGQTAFNGSQGAGLGIRRCGPLTPKATVDAFETELRKAKTPHTIEVMPEVAHAFTVPAVGTDASTGFAYDADADARRGLPGSVEWTIVVRARGRSNQS
ncbi:MAG: hypothetical protein AAGC92_06685 [Pseudomonadota bacterium]